MTLTDSNPVYLPYPEENIDDLPEIRYEIDHGILLVYLLATDEVDALRQASAFQKDTAFNSLKKREMKWSQIATTSPF